MGAGETAAGRRTWRLIVDSRVQDDVLVVTLAGRLGSAASGALVQAMVEAVRGGHRRILCDLAGVDYASSAGLLALDAVSGRICQDAGTLVLCGLTEPLRVVLELSDLLPHFTVAATREEGLALLRAGTRLQNPSLPSHS